MNYEKIILELMGRIQVLEEKMEILLKEKTEDSEQELSKITTEDIRQYIAVLKEIAKENGKNFISRSIRPDFSQKIRSIHPKASRL